METKEKEDVSLPWHDNLQTVDCGGNGDCMMLSLIFAMKGATLDLQKHVIRSIDAFQANLTIRSVHVIKDLSAFNARKNKIRALGRMRPDFLRMLVRAHVLCGREDNTIREWMRMLNKNKAYASTLFRKYPYMQPVALKTDFVTIRSKVADMVMKQSSWGDEWFAQVLSVILKINIAIVSQPESHVPTAIMFSPSRTLHHVSTGGYPTVVLYHSMSKTLDDMYSGHYEAMMQTKPAVTMFHTFISLPKSIKYFLDHK